MELELLLRILISKSQRGVTGSLLFRLVTLLVAHYAYATVARPDDAPASNRKWRQSDTAAAVGRAGVLAGRAEKTVAGGRGGSISISTSIAHCLHHIASHVTDGLGSSFWSS